VATSLCVTRALDTHCSTSNENDNNPPVFAQCYSITTSDCLRWSCLFQLAPNASKTLQIGFPDLRWSQTAGYGYVPNPTMKNVFMAVAMDLPDFDSPYGT